MKLDIWLGIVIGVLVAFWPLLIAFRYKRYTQGELVQISSEYENINAAFLKHFIVRVLSIIPLIFLPILLGGFGSSYYPMIVLSWVTILFSSLGIVYGLFAVRRGAYPVSKYLGANTTYAYSADNQITRIGRMQIILSACSIVLSILIAVIRVIVFG